MSFKRKLKALEYYGCESFDIKNEHHVKCLVAWLEDQKIRHYKIEDRKSLRDINSATWNDSFNNYLNDLKCPYNSPNFDLPAIIDWLLGLAVRFEYEENVEKYKNVTAESVNEKRNVPQVVQKNPLDNLDFDSADFKAGVDTLARLLNITLGPDHTMTLKAICELVKQRMNKEALESNQGDQGKVAVPLQEMDLGFQTGDYVMNAAAKILRLLYVKDLRNLQTRINETIVEVQNITANPKTDTRLGKVGR